MIKRLLCVLMMLMLLTASVFSLAEEAAPAAETETAAPETVEVLSEADAAPVLLVTVNGEEIKSDNHYLNQVISYYLDYAEQSGYDASDPSMLESIRQFSLDYTIHTILIRQKAAELGLDKITDEEKAAMELTAKAEWQGILDTYVAQALAEGATEDDKAAARADAEAMLLNYGYDEATYVQEYMDNTIEASLTNRVADFLLDGKTVTDEDIQSYYDGLVKADQDAYGNDIGSYEFYTTYYGQSSYYTPEGFRAVTHILLSVDEELMNTWKDLSARLEEQKSAADAEQTAAEAAETAAPEATEETEPTATPEPVTEEMVKAAEQAILDSVKDTVDEIKAKLADGVSFDELIKEYGTDPGMKNDATRAKGYAVHKDSILWDPAFTAAAMALEKVGDVGEPVVGQNGVHILHYLRDISGGAAELTDDMKEEFRAVLLNNLRNEALNKALEGWIKDGTIVYTAEGEAWKLPEDDEESAAEGTEEAEAPEAEAPEAKAPEAEDANP